MPPSGSEAVDLHPGEHETMAKVERDHWWYRGLRDAVSQVLDQPRFGLPQRPRILDVGCGTGENLRLLERRFDAAYLGGFDLAPEAVQLARQKVSARADLYAADICDPHLNTDALDLIVSLDVVYIPGVTRAFRGLQRLVGHLRPGGLMLLNLPAYNWLYSEHDVAIHTSERYTARRVAQLLERLELEPALLSYRLCLLFPLVVLSRLPSLFRARPGDVAAQSDLHRLPSPWIQRLMFGVTRFENRGVARGIRLPWGSSVFAVGRKP